MIHEDERRKLEAYQEGKMITAKEDCVVGLHYHKVKTELFTLISGECRHLYYDIRPGWKVVHDAKMYNGQIIIIHPYTYHEFHLKKGAVLIGLCSHAFDPTDDYKV